MVYRPIQIHIMKKINLSLLLLLFLLAFTACESDVIELEEMEEEQPEMIILEGLEGIFDNDECYEIVYPISYTMPDGSTVTGNNEEELEIAFREWERLNGEFDREPQLILPITVLVDENREELAINDVEGLERLERYCEDGELDDDDDREERDCSDLVYPVSYTMPDGTIIFGDNAEEIEIEFSNWYEINGDRDTRPILNLPVVVIFPHRDAPFTINTEEDWEMVREICDELHDDDDDEDCYEFVYPISFVMPDGTTLSGDEEFLDNAIREWYAMNGDNDREPTLVLPVYIEFIGRDADAMTINSEEDWRRVEEICRG